VENSSWQGLQLNHATWCGVPKFLGVSELGSGSYWHRQLQRAMQGPGHLGDSSAVSTCLGKHQCPGRLGLWKWSVRLRSHLQTLHCFECREV
jgi:hypothetical protein